MTSKTKVFKFLWAASRTFPAFPAPKCLSPSLEVSTSGRHADPVQIAGQLLGDVGLSSCRQPHGDDQGGTVGHTYWNNEGKEKTSVITFYEHGRHTQKNVFSFKTPRQSLQLSSPAIKSRQCHFCCMLNYCLSSSVIKRNVSQARMFCFFIIIFMRADQGAEVTLFPGRVTMVVKRWIRKARSNFPHRGPFNSVRERIVCTVCWFLCRCETRSTYHTGSLKSEPGFAFVARPTSRYPATSLHLNSSYRATLTFASDSQRLIKATLVSPLDQDFIKNNRGFIQVYKFHRLYWLKRASPREFQSFKKFTLCVFSPT